MMLRLIRMCARICICMRACIFLRMCARICIRICHRIWLSFCTAMHSLYTWLDGVRGRLDY